MTDCWSLGSNYHPSTQSKKISIGVMVDSSSKRKSEPNKKVGTIPRTNMPNSTTENNLNGNDNDNCTAATNQRKSAEGLGHANSPWRTPRASRGKLGTLDAVLSKQTSSLSGNKGIQKNNLTGVEEALAKDSARFFPNQTSKFQSNDGKQNTDGNEKRKNGSPERAGLVAFPTAHEVDEAIAPDKEGVGEKADNREQRSVETLRNKLCEILGTVSSPASHHSTSQIPAPGVKDLKVDRKVDLKGDIPAKSREFSDTIETDSESPDIATRRPVTRSLLKKRPPLKGKKKAKSGAPKNNKNKKQEKNTFAFEEATNENVHGVVTFTSEPSKKKYQRKTAAIERLKIHFPENDEANEIQRETYRREADAPAEKVQNRKTSSFFNTRGSSHTTPSKSTSCFLNPQRDNLYSHQSQGTRMLNKPGVLDGLGSSEKGKNQLESIVSNPFVEKAVNPQDDFQSPIFRCRTPVSSPSPCLTPENGLGPSEKEGKQKATDTFMKKAADTEADFRSPTFGFRTPISSSSPSFTPETGTIHQGDVSPGFEETRPFRRNIFSFNSHNTPKAAFDGPNTERENLPKNLRDYSSRKETSATTNEDSEGLSESSSDERDSNGSREESPLMEHLNDFREVNASPPETYSRSKFIFQPSVRITDPDVTGVREKSPTMSSPTGTHESDCFKETTGSDEEDGLGRAVTLFAMAIQNFERKLKSAARKRSSEILHSASEGICLQLQNVESHVLTDVVKLTSSSKTKRKHMETRFTEQQEQFKTTREKFENEMNHHFKDFESTLGALETNRIELKGTMKKQKASHQKLITQMEKDVETQLRDAERRITNVNQTARQKMQQLKRIVAECFKDGMMD